MTQPNNLTNEEAAQEILKLGVYEGFEMTGSRLAGDQSLPTSQRIPEATAIIDAQCKLAVEAYKAAHKDEPFRVILEQERQTTCINCGQTWMSTGTYKHECPPAGQSEEGV